MDILVLQAYRTVKRTSTQNRLFFLANEVEMVAFIEVMVPQA